MSISFLMVTDKHNLGTGDSGVVTPGVVSATVLGEDALYLNLNNINLVLSGLGVSLGFNCGYPLNPARDLAPRLIMGKNQPIMTTTH